MLCAIAPHAGFRSQPVSELVPLRAFRGIFGPIKAQVFRALFKGFRPCVELLRR